MKEPRSSNALLQERGGAKQELVLLGLLRGIDVHPQHIHLGVELLRRDGVGCGPQFVPTVVAFDTDIEHSLPLHVEL